MRLFLFSALLGALTLAAPRQAFDVQAMMKLKRIADPQASPDGKWLAFSVSTVDLDKNTRPRQIWIMPLAGGTPRAITTEGNNDRPRWSPDSKRIAFVSTRSGSSQVWLMDPDGGNARQLTTLATEAGGHIWSPDGKRLLFVSEVYPDCPDEACNAGKLDAEKASKVKARTYTTLLYRHWNQYRSARRSHLLVIPAGGGKAKDLTPGPKDVPPFSLGGPDDYAISPDSKEVAYAVNPDADEAFSTNNEIFTVPIDGGEARKVSTSLGADNSPQYSPDGKYLAWRSQARAGFESDRWRLLLFERASGRITALAENFDRPVTGFVWHPDSQRIVFTADDRGRQNAQMVGVSGGGLRLITPGAQHVDDLQFAAGGKTLLYTEQSGASPVEIFRAVSSGGSPVAMTRLNDELLAQVQLTPYEEFTAAGAEGAPVHSWLVKPPNFNPRQKYPLLLLIHGGPQGAWTQSFSYRWNPQVFAAAGYVVIAPNPRGSTGYGQKFTDEISGDWGGKCFDDLMAATDYAARLPYVDPGRMAAAGGSFGGYMVNWILGHTDRFKALVSHAGVFDLRSEAGETEELWFTNWEFKGMPWDNPEMYEKFSPSYFVKNFKTPTLVIHGELDYRVVAGQGMHLFTALQSQKVPSKFLLYPDEGHWVLKPQNSVLWYNTFLDWVGEWTKKQ